MHDLDLPSDSVRNIAPVTAPDFDLEQIVPSEDGWMDPAMEAAHSAAIEPNANFTSYETYVDRHSDSSPATDSEPPVSVPI